MADEETVNPKKAKLNPNAVLKTLPKGFTGVHVPKNTRTLFMKADLSIITYTDAKKSAKSAAKTLGLSLVREKRDDESKNVQFCFEDIQFNKDMRASANAAWKAVKAFYDKYGDAYMYDDLAYEAVIKIIRKVDNDE